jgi:hypothetical protein
MGDHRANLLHQSQKTIQNSFRAAAITNRKTKPPETTHLKTLSSSNPSTKKESINSHTAGSEEREADKPEAHLIAIIPGRYIVRIRGDQWI